MAPPSRGGSSGSLTTESRDRGPSTGPPGGRRARGPVFFELLASPALRGGRRAYLDTGPAPPVRPVTGGRPRPKDGDCGHPFFPFRGGSHGRSPDAPGDPSFRALPFAGGPGA